MAITAPYNFVPLSEQVFFPDWADQVSHDVPFEDGISGTLALKITAHTPLLVGDKQPSEKGQPTIATPFQLPPMPNETEGRYAIPGTSLRGMIRNVLEIASFGKMQRVDDRRYAVRDFNADFYDKEMLKNKSSGGWLKYQEGQWKLTTCQYVKVKQYLLEDYKTNGKILEHKLAEKNDSKFIYEMASKKYQAWHKVHKSLDIEFDTDDNGKATNLGKGSLKGKLVLCGQAGKKNHEFIFFNTNSEIPVLNSTMSDFLFIYDTKATNPEEEPHWSYLKENERKEGIPVFYKKKGEKEISSIGLSQVYKLAYKNTIYDAIRNTAKGIHLDDSRRDLAELIFGYTDDSTSEENSSDRSLKGRVSFSHAVCEQTNVITKEESTILNSPKPTYYPNYIKQDAPENKTYMDEVELRGWKRYPVRKNTNIPKPAENQSIAVQSIITVLQPDPILSFTAKIRFHNLRPMELGAIIWAVKWGNNDNLRHTIGMGKSFGCGQLSIKMIDEKVGVISNNNQEISLDTCLQQYQNCMDKEVDEWKNSEQLYQLTNMADPEVAPGNINKLTHMDLLEYATNKNNGARLDPYVTRVIPQTPKEWMEATVTKLEEKEKDKEKPLTRNKIIFKKGLLFEWQKIDDITFKNTVKKVIKLEWNEVRGDGFWDNPIGKKTIEVRKLYDE